MLGLTRSEWALLCVGVLGSVLGGMLVVTLPPVVWLVAAGAAVSVWAAASMVSNNTIDRWVYMPVALILGAYAAHTVELREADVRQVGAGGDRRE